MHVPTELLFITPIYHTKYNFLFYKPYTMSIMFCKVHRAPEFRCMYMYVKTSLVPSSAVSFIFHQIAVTDS